MADAASRPSISAIVPVFNEAQAVEHGVRSVAQFLGQHAFAFEIIVVESGSSDGTAGICDALARDCAQVRVIHEERRNGFGAAMMLGFRNATKDLLWPVPVDLPFPLQALLDAVPLAERHDAVISYRSDDRRTLYRRFQSLVYQRACRVLLGLKVRNVNSAFKLLRREAVDGLEVRTRGWGFDAELLYRLSARGARFAEIPIPLVERTVGRSTVKPLDAVRTLCELARVRLDSRSTPQPPAR